MSGRRSKALKRAYNDCWGRLTPEVAQAQDLDPNTMHSYRYWRRIMLQHRRLNGR